LVIFPRQLHRGAVWIGRQRQSQPWAVLTAICGRGLQVRLCGCFQTGFGPFSLAIDSWAALAFESDAGEYGCPAVIQMKPNLLFCARLYSALRG